MESYVDSKPKAALTPTEIKEIALFCANPSGRYITNAAGERVLCFSGTVTAEISKRILLTGCQLLAILAEHDKGIPKSCEGSIQQAISRLPAPIRENPSSLFMHHWEAHGDVIRDFPSGVVIATLLAPPPPRFTELMDSPKICAHALKILSAWDFDR